MQISAVIDRFVGRLPDLDPRRALLLSVAVFLVPIAFVLVVPHALEQPIGVDFRLYHEAATRWLTGGSFYEPYQLAGPYEIHAGDILYPPVALWLFVPFAIVNAPPFSLWIVGWWLIPLGITAWAVVHLRPRPIVWPLIALCLSNPTTLLKIWTGNPVMWSMAAIALAVVSSSRFFAPFVLLKPSLGPFAVFGINRRSWWLGLIVFGGLCLPFGALWADWLASVLNSRGGGVLYSALEAPFLLLPLVTWLGRDPDRRGTPRFLARSVTDRLP